MIRNRMRWFAGGPLVASMAMAMAVPVALASPMSAITATAAVVTAINSKPGDVLAWSETFDASAWNKQLVAKG